MIETAIIRSPPVMPAAQSPPSAGARSLRNAQRIRLPSMVTVSSTVKAAYSTPGV